jgi:hypothetical protein
MPFFLHVIFVGEDARAMIRSLTTEFVYTFWGVIELILLLARSHTIASDVAHTCTKSHSLRQKRINAHY